MKDKPKNSLAAVIELLVLSNCFGSRNGCLNQYNKHFLEERKKTSLPLGLECDVIMVFYLLFVRLFVFAVEMDV